MSIIINCRKSWWWWWWQLSKFGFVFALNVDFEASTREEQRGERMRRLLAFAQHRDQSAERCSMRKLRNCWKLRNPRSLQIRSGRARSGLQAIVLHSVLIVLIKLDGKHQVVERLCLIIAYVNVNRYPWTAAHGDFRLRCDRFLIYRHVCNKATMRIFYGYLPCLHSPHWIGETVTKSSIVDDKEMPRSEATPDVSVDARWYFKFTKFAMCSEQSFSGKSISDTLNVPL